MVARSELDVAVNGTDNLSPTLDQIQSRLIRLVGFVSSTMTALSIASFPISAVRGFEKEMANVQKTTGFTDAQIKTLGNSLVDMSRKINVTAEDLAKIAAAAGQQGLGREGVDGIRQFTESVSRMSSVLDVTVEQAGTDIGKIASIFRVPLRDLESAVSAFNQVSNNSTASGEQLLDVVKRIGDAAGSLNLQQSIGLSATGIDLGLSPEVVGSSFQKVFAEMYARAGQFTNLLGGSVDDWIKKVQSNGIDALKEYLAGLRKLTPEAQQQTIKALSGGGRIGALVTKLLQDTEDTILDRNVAQATQGITTGTSAIKEQSTVLATLDAQIQQARNSFQALGIKAGEVFGPRLTTYFVQLNDALANPAVVQFAEAVGGAFLDLFDTIVKGVKFVNALNLDWSNFITLAKIFIGLKLAQAIGGWLTSLPGLSRAYQNLALSATEAAAAQERQAAGGTTVFAASLARIRELIAAQAQRNLAIQAEAKATAEAAAAQKALHAAQVDRLNKAGALAAAQDALAKSPQAQAVSTARSGVAAAEGNATAARVAVEQAANARLERAAQEHTQRVVAIEAERVRLQAEARAAGDRSALLAATRARNEQLAAEEQTYARSLTQINAYYARRLQAVTAAGAAEVAASKATFAASLSAFDAAAASPGIVNLQTQANAAGLRVQNLSVQLAEATTQLTLTQRAAALAGAGMGALATGVRIAATAFRGLVAIAGRVFFWLTIIYTLLEAFGITDKIAQGFQNLTDKMGITDKASRDLAARERERAAAHDEADQAARRAAEGLQKYIDAGTGQIDDSFLKQFELNLKTDDRDAFLKQFTEVADVIAATQAKLDTLNDAKPQISLDVTDFTAAKNTAEANIASLEAKLAGLEADVKATQLVPDESGQLALTLQSQIAETRAAITTQKNLLKLALDDLSKYGTDAAGVVDTGIANTTASLQKMQQLASKTFTEQSAKVFSDNFDGYVEAVDKVSAATKRQQETQKAYTEAQGADVSAAAKLAAEEANKSAIAQLEAANGAVQAIKTNVINQIEELKANGGLTPAIIGSLDILKQYFNLTNTQISGLLAGVNAVRQAGTGFTGTLAAPETKPAQGTGTNETETKSEARRRRSAELELEKAKLQAESELLREANDQKSSDNEDAYKQNLKSISNYYAERLRLQRADIDIEAKLRRQELEALQGTLAEADGASEKLRIQAQIAKAEGDIKLLDLQKSALEKDNNRAMRDALRDFTDRVTDQKAALVEYFGSDAQTAFTASLESAAASYRDFVDRLQQEAQSQPELLKIVDQIKLKASFDAVEAGLDAIARKSDITTSRLQINADKIQALGDAGLITIDQQNTLEEALRKTRIKAGEEDIRQKEAALASFEAMEGAAVRSTQKYQELSVQIEQARSQVDLLKIQGDKVAKEINEEIKTNLSDAIKSLYGDNAGDWRQAISDFFTGVLESLADRASDSLADTLYSAMNSALSDASSGLFSTFGDLFSPIFQTDVGSATGAANSALSSLGAGVLGSSPATPLYTTSVSSLPGAGEDVPGLGDLLGKGKDATDQYENISSVDALPDKGFFTSTFDSLTSSISSFASSVGSGISAVGSSIAGAFTSGLDALQGFFAPLFQSLIAAVTTSGTAGTATAGIGAAAGAAGAAAAHNGGIAGRTTMRRTGISPAVFANAVRHHVGGKAGGDGLAPSEVPVILEKGEEILTRKDPRHQDNLGEGAIPGGSSGGGGGSQTTFNVQPVLSEDAVLDAFKGSKGQKQLLVVIGKNPQGFRQALGLNKG